jgi:hypothetical protein
MTMTVDKTSSAINWMCYSQVDYATVQESDILTIKKYIQNVINLQAEKSCIRLPSVEAIKDFFSVNNQTVMDCLREMKHEGYHFMIIDQSHPVLVWDALALEPLS